MWHSKLAQNLRNICTVHHVFLFKEKTEKLLMSVAVKVMWALSGGIFFPSIKVRVIRQRTLISWGHELDAFDPFQKMCGMSCLRKTSSPLSSGTLLESSSLMSSRPINTLYWNFIRVRYRTTYWLKIRVLQPATALSVYSCYMISTEVVVTDTDFCLQSPKHGNSKLRKKLFLPLLYWCRYTLTRFIARNIK